MAPEPEVGDHVSALTSVNRLSANRLSANGLTLNRLSANRLSANRLSANRLSANALSSPLYMTPEGRELMTYVIRCALVRSDTLQVEVDGVIYEFFGLLGLAPKWADEPLDFEGKAWMSSCLLAHVNDVGVSVPISLRANNTALKTLEPDEAWDYPYQEAAFYGDLFAQQQLMYGCVGWDAQGAYGGHSPYLPQRVCVVGTPTGSTSPCGFVNAGVCEATCKRSRNTTNAPYSEAWSDCATREVAGGHADSSKADPFHYAITVYLGRQP